MSKMKISIVKPNTYLKEDGTFNLEEAKILSGHIAGECYDEDGLENIQKEPREKTEKRIKSTLEHGHHSVYGHEYIKFNIENIPKVLAMVINNEKEYTTSEKSGRYTRVEQDDDSLITSQESELYDKWLKIFTTKIKEKYGDTFTNRKIRTLAQENARYVVTAFMPTKMIYTTSLRQINYIVSWLEKYQLEVKEKGEKATYFEKTLANSMNEFVENMSKLNILEPGLLNNAKNRSISLFNKTGYEREEYYGDMYSTNYKATFPGLGQAQRHRTLSYEMQLPQPGEEEYFIPPIIEDEPMLVDEWLCDMESIKDKIPNGLLVNVNERGTYENFILKCKERLCSEAQLEIADQTKETLTKYYEALIEKNHPLAEDMEKYTHGARCTFPDFKCSSDCKFKEGKILVRKI